MDEKQDTIIELLRENAEQYWEEIEAQRKLASGYYDEAKKALEQRDEWKRRVDVIRQWGSSFIMIGGFTFWEKFLMEHPEAKDWFKED